MPAEKIIGANQESVQGPGTITHEGGDPILVAEVDGGLPGAEHALVFEGTETRDEDGDDVFEASDPSSRSYEFPNTVVIRALGQANYSFTKKAAKKEAEKVAA